MRGSVEDRFWSRVAVGPECWLWLGAKNDKGYGQLYVAGRMEYAHRVSHELFLFPIPSGLFIDHRCRNTSCVNPAHITPETNRVNTLLGVGPTAKLARLTHCIRGHEFTPENTYVRKDTGHRQCKKCGRLRALGAA